MFSRTVSRRTIAAAVFFACLAVVVATSSPAAAAKADQAQPAVQDPGSRQLLARLDCLADMPGPRPGIASKAFLPFLGETRTWLADAAAQDALLRDLPTLTTRQLVTLWDVLWIAPPQADGRASSPRDMDSLAPGFARRFNDAALAALAEETAPDRRRLLINMLKPQAETFTEKQATEFLKAGGWKE